MRFLSSGAGDEFESAFQDPRKLFRGAVAYVALPQLRQFARTSFRAAPTRPRHEFMVRDSDRELPCLKDPFRPKSTLPSNLTESLFVSHSLSPFEVCFGVTTSERCAMPLKNCGSGELRSVSH